ncbi:MAG: hypothetical protein AAFO83_03415 [Cyanobacteria bacterium J06607_13]
MSRKTQYGQVPHNPYYQGQVQVPVGQPQAAVYAPGAAPPTYGLLYTADGTPVDARNYLKGQEFADVPDYLNPSVNKFASGHYLFRLLRCWRHAFWGTTVVVLGVVGGITIARGAFTGAVASAYGVQPVGLSQVDGNDWSQVGYALGSQVAWTGKAAAPVMGGQLASFAASDPLVAQQISRQGTDSVDAQLVNYVELQGGR